MAQIKVDYNVGGESLNPLDSTTVRPSLAAVLRDIADDLATLTPANIASADATDLPEALTLVNEIKAALNVISGGTILTTKV